MIGFEFILALIIFFAGKTLWQLFKRGRFLQRLGQSQSDMAGFISMEVLVAFSQKNPMYVTKGPQGYISNISALIDVDLSTQRRLKLLFASINVLVLIISAYFSIVFLLVNIILFLVAGLYPLTESGRQNARDLLITLGAILHKWREENPKECDEWIEQASTLRELYAVIQITK